MDSYLIDESEDGIGRVLVPRGPWQAAYGALIERDRIDGVRLSDSMGWIGSDIQFLGSLASLKGVEVYSRQVKDLSPLAAHPRVRLIGLDCDIRGAVDFRGFDELEIAKVRWSPALASLLRVASLKQLNLSQWPGPDLLPLQELRGLERLLLTSRALSSIRGIEALASIQWLDLHACPKLASLDPIKGCRRLRHLELTACKAIRDISPLSELTGLRALHLDDDGDIDSLLPLGACRRLEVLSFLGTTRVSDGRLSILERLPRLTTLRFTPRGSYDRTREELLRKPPPPHAG